MLRKIIVAAAAVSILAGTAISANSQSRHHSRFEYVVTEYHGNCQRHLSRKENFGDALF